MGLIKPGDGFLYMKVGMHAAESLDDIRERKAKEIRDAGYALWGYGGNTCHPLSMVQPFAKEYEQRGGAIYLCMEPMNSKHDAPPERAIQYSEDGMSWQDIPDAINVLGSRYALVIRDLHPEKFDVALAKTRVAIGNSMGRTGDKYIRGRVDKACLEVVGSPEAEPQQENTVHIGLVARIVEPYAVFVRGRN